MTKQDQLLPKRVSVFPEGRRTLYDQNAYSAAIRSGDLLFVSGQVGSREDGSPEPHFKSQSDLPSRTFDLC